MLNPTVSDQMWWPPQSLVMIRPCGPHLAGRASCSSQVAAHEPGRNVSGGEHGHSERWLVVGPT